MGRQSVEPGNVSQRVVDILSAALAESDMSQRGLAEKANINRGRVQRTLNGERPITVDELEKLAEALGLVGWVVLRHAEQPELDVLETIQGGGVGLNAQPDLTSLDVRAAAKRDKEGPLEGQGEHNEP